MKSHLMMIPAAAMVVCLVTYAFSSASPQSSPLNRTREAIPGRPADVPPTTADSPARSAVPMRAIAPDRVSAEQSDDLARRERQIKQQLSAREEAIIAQLGLSDRQMGEYRQLSDQLREQTALMKTQSSGHIQRGIEINNQFNDGLRRIFTPDQFQKYLDLWKRPAENSAAPTAAPESRVAAPFGCS